MALRVAALTLTASRAPEVTTQLPDRGRTAPDTGPPATPHPIRLAD